MQRTVGAVNQGSMSLESPRIVSTERDNVKSPSLVIAVLAALTGALASLALSSCSGLPNGERCTIRPLHAGVCRLGADHVLGEGRSPDERLDFVIYAFLVEGPSGERALVDLGPESLEYCNEMFRHWGFFRDLGPDASPAERYPDDIVQPRGNAFAQLDALGVSLDSIDHVVFTHLHADHHGMDDATDGGAAERLPDATLWVSKRGWEDNLAKRGEDGRWGSYVDFAFGDFLLERERERTAYFEDDATVFPGLRTMYLGGHSPCSQAVIVDAPGGPAIIASDDIYLYELLEKGILPEIRTSEAAYRDALRRLVELAEREGGVIVPLHDPLVWEAFLEAEAGTASDAAARALGKTWLERLRRHSDRAIAGYRRAETRRGARGLDASQ